MLIIACNSISSVAYDVVKKHVGNNSIVVNVIDPVAEFVSDKKSGSKIGVIGTKATIKSDVYAKKITSLNKKLSVSSQATPLLAPMIEEGFFNNKISRTIINDYLSRPKLKDIDTLILGCTHYPLIRPEIEQFYKKKISIVDSAEIVALYVRSLLLKHHLMNAGKAKKHHFYISDYTNSFEQSTKIFFKGKVKLEKKNLWQ
jgi:glutamate racemase